MKTIKLICIILIYISVTTGLGFAAETQKTISFAGQWPFRPTKSIAIDHDRSLVFLGDGEQINILDTDLDYIAAYPATKTGVITAVFYLQQDNLLFVACKNDGIKIFDTQVTMTPVLLGEYQHSDEIFGVYVHQGMMFLACGLNGFEILTVDDPENPLLLSSVKLPGAWNISYALDVIIQNNYLYIADIYNGVHIADITDPENPELKKIIALAGARDLAINDQFLYVSLEGIGIEIIDISEPENPTEASTYVFENSNKSIRISGNFGYISYESSGIHLIDISDPTSPIHDSSWKYQITGATSLELFSVDNALYLTDNQIGLQKIDISDKTDMKQVAVFDTPGDAFSIAATENHVYILDNNSGLNPSIEGMRILEMKEISSGVIQFNLVGFCATPGNANDIFIKDQYAFVADGAEGIQIIDTIDKSNPSIIGALENIGDAKSLHVDGNFALLATGETGMRIVDVSDKTKPELISSYINGSNICDVFISGIYAFILIENKGFEIIDITDKTHPFYVSSFISNNETNDIFVSKNNIFLAEGIHGISIIDISNSVNPTLIASYKTSRADAQKIKVLGNYAYIANGASGLTVLDISDANAISEEPNWSYDSLGFTSDVFSGVTFDDELYTLIGDGPAGLVALSLAVEDIIDGEDNNENKSSDSGGCFLQILKKNDY